MRVLIGLAASIWAAFAPGIGAAQTPVFSPDQDYRIILSGAGDQTLHVATIRFMPPDAEGWQIYQLSWNETQFGDYFLSMRPFRCMAGPKTHLCRVPYPYENPPKIRGGDLTSLEYDLLFLWKPATAYGIDMWNGLYFELNDANGQISASLNELDIGQLAVPPQTLRPIEPKDLHPAEPAGHWLPYLTIEN